MRKTKKAIASLAIAGMVLSMAPMSVFGATTDTTRLGGVGRVETAIAIATEGWTSADSVIVVPADDANTVDALAAAPLAGQLNAPILLTYKDALDPQVQQKIVDLGAKKVYAVGALKADTVASLKAISGVEVTLLQGADRTETAGKVAAQLSDVKGTFVVAYDGVADALSAASFAAANDYSIVIANPDKTIPASEKVVGTVYTVGGQAKYDGATALYGTDRYATNEAVVDGLEFSYDKVYVANGQNPVDALAGAPLAAQTNSPIVLGDAIDVATAANDNLTADSQVIALGGTGAVSNSVLGKVSYDAPAVFGVESVEAANLIQVEVQLTNTNYDQDELEDVTNYDFEGDDATDSSSSNTGVDVREAEVDGTTLTLTLTNPVENQSEGTLTIDEIITGEELEFDGIQFTDNEIPTIEDVKVIGKDTVKFTFSEPINITDASKDEFDFELNEKTHSPKSIESINNGFEANVTVYGEFTEGTLAVEVGNGLEDFANFNIVSKTFEVDVVEDTEAPVVTGYKSAKANEVTLIFNEDIQLESTDVGDYYHTNTNNEVSTINRSQIDGNELTLDFTANELPDGTAYVYIESGSLSDLWDNENNSIKVEVETDIDNTKPVVKEVEYDAGVITVSFSEEMDIADTALDPDNYVLEDEDGDAVSITDAVRGSSDKKVELVLRDGQPDEGTYSLTISNVEDLAGNEIDETTQEVVITDSEDPEFPTNAYFDLSGSKYRIYIEFDEEMAVDGNYSVTDLAKYEVTSSSTINLGEANDDDDYDVDLDVIDNGKTVRITSDYPFSDSDDNGTLDQTIKLVGRVADVEGNYTAASESLAMPISDKDDRKISIDAAKAKSATTLEVDFGGNIESYDEEDFVVWADGTDADGSASLPAGLVDSKYNSNEVRYTVTDITAKDADTLTIEIDEDTKLPADAENMKLYLGTRENTETANAYGVKLQGGIGGTFSVGEVVVDKIAPNVLKEDNVNDSLAHGNGGTDDDVAAVYAAYDGTTYSTITIVFNEKVDTTLLNESLVTVKKGGTSTKFTVVDLTNPTSDGKTIEVKVSGGGVNGKVAKGDTIDFAIVYDKALAPNSTSGLQLRVEYPVTE